MTDNNRPAAPNYTNACIVMFGVNLTWVFFALWAIWGLIAVIVTGWLIHRGLCLLEARRA